MRRDMAKKLVERPRHGAGWKRKSRGRATADMPRREPMSMGRGSKGFGENLAPLRRFLHRSVGRPWDDVYSEIRAHLGPRSTVHMHVLVHLDRMVEKHPVFIDGRPYHPEASAGRYQPIRGSRWDCLYVCPETGTLQCYRRPRANPGA